MVSVGSLGSVRSLEFCSPDLQIRSEDSAAIGNGSGSVGSVAIGSAAIVIASNL